MGLYCIGDLQGCAASFQTLLETIDFSPSRDTLYLLGDLVNRGPDSLAALEQVVALGGSAKCLLGNHDIHCLAVSQGLRASGRQDTLQALLASSRKNELMDWLRQQPLAIHAHDTLMVHAGVQPSWTAAETCALAAEVQSALSGPDWRLVLIDLFGNEPDLWDNNLSGMPRLRSIVNTLTRMRYCSSDGQLDLKTKVRNDAPASKWMPWFDVPGRKTADTTIVFGHWSTLGWLNRTDVFCLDSGCVWGGRLTALRLGASAQAHEAIWVPCPQAQVPFTAN